MFNNFARYSHVIHGQLNESILFKWYAVQQREQIDGKQGFHNNDKYIVVQFQQ